MKEISCGVIIKNSKGQILGCVPYGRSDGRLDLPKGHVEDSEEYIETAIREVYEETGILIPKEALTPIGMFQYLSYKDLYLFSCECEIENVNELICSSHHIDKYTGRKVPEMIGWQWVSKEEIEDKFFISLSKILKTL